MYIVFYMITETLKRGYVISTEALRNSESGKMERRVKKLREKLDGREALGPMDMAIYACMIKRISGAPFNEPPATESWKSADMFGIHWKAFEEMARDKTFRGPTEGWGVLNSPKGWSAICDFMGCQDLGVQAIKFVQDRVIEIQQFNQMPYVTEDIVNTRENHIESLEKTALIIATPRESLSEDIN